MRKLTLLVLLALLGIAAILIPQFQSLERMGARRLEQGANAAPTELTVGVSWPFATLGDGFAEGLRLGADRAKTHEGISIRLILRDDGDDWDIARRIALDFADTPGMGAVVGYHDPALAVRASGIFQSARLPHLVAAPLASAPAHDLMVRLLPPTANLIDALAAAVPGTYAVVAEDDANARRLADLFHVRHGSDRRLDLTYHRRAPDFHTPVIEIARLQPQSVLFSGDTPEAAGFLTLLRGRGITIPVLLPMVGAEQMRNPVFKNVLTADFYDPAAETEANRAFLQAFRSRYGHDPDSWAALGYDAALLLARGSVESTSSRPQDLSETIHALTEFEGAVGPYHYDRNGALEGRTAVVRQQ